MESLQPILHTLGTNLGNTYRIIMDLGDCFYNVPLHPDDYKGFAFRDLVFLITYEAIYIIGKFFLEEWLIALYYVVNLASASIQEVRTLNLPVYIII